MEESDFEVEYLEEDEDLVHHYMETIESAPQPNLITIKPPKIFGGQSRQINPNPLLTERVCLQNDSDEEKTTRKRFKREKNSDSDYDPSQDNSEDEPILDDFEKPKALKKQMKLLNPDNAQSVTFPPKLHPPSNTLEQPMKIKTLKSLSSPAKDSGPMALKNSKFIVKYEKKYANNSKLLPKTGSISISTTEISLNKTHTTTKSRTSHITLPSRKKYVRTYSRAPDVEPFKIFPPGSDPIHLYDYDDPKYIIGAKLLSDENSLKKWNDTCRKQAKKYEEMDQNVKASRTIQYIRNVDVKTKGKVETFLKLHTETKSDNKTDLFQVILPKFQCQTMPTIKVNYRQPSVKRNESKKIEIVTLLSTETTKEGRILVAYRPTDCRSTTFKMIDAEKTKGDYKKPHLQMLMSCKMCAKCYQYSWRGSKDSRTKSAARCAVCSSVFTSAYNLLSHVRSHDDHDVRQCRWQQTKVLAEIVGYHYICRICKFKAKSIENLRSHLNVHSGMQRFKCEVGQHITK